ncbi:MAG: DUF5060 domain-containing protein [Spirochaetaceae bacterium]|nr:MAG: DUF5060 domain-containing protein [Spirochaetaceae bacterium]
MTKAKAGSQTVKVWDFIELEWKGPTARNPFTEVKFGATFTTGNRTVRVGGFYDGAGSYKVRFMPDTAGEWRFETYSTVTALTGKAGSITALDPDSSVHGPVQVHTPYSFQYADGAPFFPVGTTCYAWTHQSTKLQDKTVSILKTGPFNKIRMCVFPKDYSYNKNEPEHYVYEGAPGAFDFTRFNPASFAAFEKRIAQLRDLGIEADIIIFHPYDRWGFATMTAAQDDLYLEYLVARLAAFRNVWWSFANEFDLMKEKTTADWDRYFRIVQTADPYQHLRSVHNCRAFYDHTKAWVTHVSVQHSDVERVDEWRSQYRKPVVIDECCYEGDIQHNWGNITAQELVRRMWETTVRGGFPTGHGETYLNPDDVLWWAKGGILRGESPARFAFLRKIMEEAPLGDLNPERVGRLHPVLAKRDEWFLYYYGVRQPSIFDVDLPADANFVVDLIDTWEMKVTRLKGTYSGPTRFELPGKPWMAIRAVRKG